MSVKGRGVLQARRSLDPSCAGEGEECRSHRIEKTRRQDAVFYTYGSGPWDRLEIVAWPQEVVDFIEDDPRSLVV